MSLPSSSRIWQYTTTSGGIVANLKLNTIPMPTPKSNEHLIQIIATGLNPVDFKPAEAPLLSYFLIKKPATPGIDIAARIVTPAAGSPLKPGQLVFGAASNNPLAGGGLTEYKTVLEDMLLPIPEGVTITEAAGLPVACLTAYQSIVPHVRKGDRVFLNGGSGGVGLLGIQVAKAIGCHVTVTCSSRNVDFCKQYGADDVIDYTAGDVFTALKKVPQFDHFVDNVGSNRDFYWRCHEFTKPGTKYINVASAPTMADARFHLRALLPSFLGGGRRKLVGMLAQKNDDHINQMLEWMKEGKIKATTDSIFPFEQAPEAFKKLKTGRARGKIIVEVEPQSLKS